LVGCRKGQFDKFLTFSEFGIKRIESPEEIYTDSV
jgi:hypothetical protein